MTCVIARGYRQEKKTNGTIYELFHGHLLNQVLDMRHGQLCDIEFFFFNLPDDIS